MANGYFDTVLSLTDARRSALFYEHVIPIAPYNLFLSLAKLWTSKKKDDSDEAKQLFDYYTKIFRDLAPDHLRDDMEHWSALLQPYGDDIYRVVGRTVSTTVELSSFLTKFDLHKLPCDVPQEMVSKEGASEAELCITLASKSIIEVDSVDWKQIMEFRKDREAREKLRRFRLFAYDNYLGKSKAYIEDDILQRMDDYETTVKQWRFETAEGAYNILFSPKTLAGTGAGAVLSTLSGAPVTAV